MEWSHEQLTAQVEDGVGETVHREFKSSDSIASSEGIKKELSKDISAMANADGGDVIYGVAEPQKGYFELDGGVDIAMFNEEWLDNVLGSIIRPRIPGLRIHTVRRPESVDRASYVVHVPRSGHAPHMAKNGRYYRRRNVKSEPMEEYEVRELYRRTEGPLLRLHFRVSPRFPKIPNRIELTPILLNQSIVPSHFQRIEIVMPRTVRVGELEHPWQHTPDPNVRFIEEAWEVAGPLHSVGMSFAERDAAPIFRGIQANLPEVTLHLARNQLKEIEAGEPCLLAVCISAPHMIEQYGFGGIVLQDGEWLVTIQGWIGGDGVRSG